MRTADINPHDGSRVKQGEFFEESGSSPPCDAESTAVSHESRKEGSDV